MLAHMPSVDRLLKLLETSPGDDFLLYALAMEHAKQAEHETALAYFDRAIEADRGNAYHYYHKARSLEALQRIDEAIATLRLGADVARGGEEEKALSEILGYLDMIHTNWRRN